MVIKWCNLSYPLLHVYRNKTPPPFNIFPKQSLIKNVKKFKSIMSINF